MHIDCNPNATDNDAVLTVLARAAKAEA